jgi:cell division protein FtsB
MMNDQLAIRTAILEGVREPQTVLSDQREILSLKRRNLELQAENEKIKKENEELKKSMTVREVFRQRS